MCTSASKQNSEEKKKDSEDLSVLSTQNLSMSNEGQKAENKTECNFSPLMLTVRGVLWDLQPKSRALF